ncbi:hypothetical protein BO71DRAFT_399917 [Aspergillus ellipticus CBS 707.79]|uniref:Ribosomal protein S21 n=1 Tax=Aspergillus ellipticus CBS 707.79 TaxID=1448320 RepID=A0A319EQS9_9EURO|nr:hypothetical protein BO71DRAFT_399917 [Aspergillus ellipticus CBS 707.79]
MEMRLLSQTVLRARPTPTTSTTTKLTTLYTTQTQVRHSSNQFPRPRTQPFNRSPFQPSTQPSDFDSILNKLNINATNNKPSTPAASSPTATGAFSDSLNRAVSQSARTDSLRAASRTRVELKLGPNLGRQVLVEPERGNDLANALRSLNSLCMSNNLKHQERMQKYHVRRGKLRKDLKSKRWRKLFKFSFLDTVKRVQRMRAQGW